MLKRKFEGQGLLLDMKPLIHLTIKLDRLSLH